MSIKEKLEYLRELREMLALLKANYEINGSQREKLVQAITSKYSVVLEADA